MYCWCCLIVTIKILVVLFFFFLWLVLRRDISVTVPTLSCRVVPRSMTMLRFAQVRLPHYERAPRAPSRRLAI